MKMKRSVRQSAFTLLELVLVMVIIAIVLAAVAPKLRGWSRGRELRDAADAFVDMTRYARAQSAADGTTYRLTIDSTAGTYQLTKLDGAQFVAVPFDFGQPKKVPDGYRIELAAQQGAATTSNTIDFYPSGRAQVAQVRISAPSGETMQIACVAAAEEFAIVTGVVQ
jgi:type II secretion system protein H